MAMEWIVYPLFDANTLNMEKNNFDRQKCNDIQEII